MPDTREINPLGVGLGAVGVGVVGYGIHIVQYSNKHIVQYSQHLDGRVPRKLAADNYGHKEWWLLLDAVAS